MSTEVQDVAHWGLVGSLFVFLVCLTYMLWSSGILKSGFNGTSIGAYVGLLGACGFGVGLVGATPIDTAADAALNDFQLTMVIGGGVAVMGLVWFFMTYACAVKPAVVKVVR